MVFDNEKKKFFSKFLKKNKKIIFKKENNFSTLIIDRGRFLAALQSSLFASIKNKKNSHNVYTLISNPKNEDLINFYKSFGENRIFKLRSNFIYTIFYTIISLFISLINFVKVKIKGIQWFIENFRVNKIILGDLIYDSHIRFDHKYISFNPNISFFKVLLVSVFKCLMINHFLKKLNVKTIIISQDLMATNGGIAVRLGNKNNIKVIEPACNYKRNHYFIVHTKNNFKYGVDNFYYNNLKFNKIKFNKLRFSEKKINTFLKRRLEGKIEVNYTGIIDLMNANKSKKIFNKKDLLNQLKVKNRKINKIYLFAPHAFSDAPHGQGKEILFRDYYSHCKETLNFIKNNNFKNSLWIVRPHPTRIKYGEKKIFNDLFKKEIGKKNKQIKLCPDQINTLSLLNICDHVVTLKGTIAIEFASYGKKAITCATTPYSKMGVTLEANTKSKYFKNIIKTHKGNSFISKKQKKIAQKILYSMETFTPSNMIGNSKILTKELMRRLSSPSKDLDHELFSSETIKKLEIYGFNNDSYYNDLYKLL